MKLSLVFPVLETRKQILTRAQDLVSFWSKFPVDVEVLLVADPLPGFSAADCEEELLALTDTTRVRFRVLNHQRRHGRGASVLHGLREATGEVIAVNSFDLAIPLSEIFSGLQEFILHRDQSFLLLGNRRGAKKKRQESKKGLRAFFEGVEHEKAQALQVQDPTCPFFMVKKQDWERLGLTRLRSWFYTPPLLQAARRKGLEIRELEVLSRGDADSRFRFWESFF